MAQSEGLHAHFDVGDVANFSVLGLDGSEYVDFLSGNLRRQQVAPVRFDAELDRIHVNIQATRISMYSRLDGDGN